jgi:fucose 4-O-acetylase-like acetyltransferase
LIIALICSISFAIDYLFLKGYRGDLHKLDIGNPLIYILCSISGLSFVFCLSLLLNLLVKGIRKILSFWGENSLVIMTTHAEYFINASVFYLVTFTFEYLSINLTAKLTSLISLVIIMLIESGIIYIVNHTKLRYIYHFPDLVGVRRKMYK